MKKNNLIQNKDITNLIRIAYLSKRLSLYGKKLMLNQDDIDCIYNIMCGYSRLMERCQNYENRK